MQYFFFLLAISSFSFFLVKRVLALLSLIKLGQADLKVYHFPTQFKRLLLVAFGQSKMRKKPLSALLHAFIYLSFLLIALLFLETILDGFINTHHSLSIIPGYYWLIYVSEILALLAMTASVAFYLRRNFFKVNRLSHSDLGKKEKSDANLILILEFFSTLFYLLERSTYATINKSITPPITQSVSNILISLFDSNTIFILECFFWWSHLLLVLCFTIYVFHSKHLHIFLAFPTVFFSKQHGEHLSNMPSISSEVKAILGMEHQEQPENTTNFGVKNVTDLKQSQILGALSCTECGRCSDVCPANATGKKLSPRKIMMATRDCLEETSKKVKEEVNLFDLISEEEIWGCTTCMACIEACPIMINPMEIIIDLRRYLIMEQSKQPIALEESFGNLETNGAPWKFNSEMREDWLKNV